MRDKIGYVVSARTQPHTHFNFSRSLHDTHHLNFSFSLRNAHTPVAVSKHFEATFKLHSVCLTAEVYREKYERLKSKLDVMTSQFDHIKQKYESAEKTDSRIRKEMGKQLQVGVHRVNALLKDPDNPELGTPPSARTRPRSTPTRPRPVARPATPTAPSRSPTSRPSARPSACHTMRARPASRRRRERSWRSTRPRWPTPRATWRTRSKMVRA